MHTKNDITTIGHGIFAHLQSSLPEWRDRLVCNRQARNHGSCRTFLMFNIWDQHQTDELNREHLCYGLRYDPLHIKIPKTWCFMLWANTVRIYQEIEETRNLFEKRLPKLVPKPFVGEIEQRGVSVRLDYEWSKSLDAMADWVAPHAANLVSALHPPLMHLIDSFTTPFSPEERREVIAGRKREYYGPVKRRSPEVIREYTRSIPPSYRKAVLVKFEHRCVHCGADLREVEVHIDHKVPFSKGGKTVIENLQPLCAPCNLSKGNRMMR